MIARRILCFASVLLVWAAFADAAVAQSSQAIDWEMLPRLVVGSDGIPRYANDAADVSDGPFRVRLTVGRPVCRPGATYEWQVAGETIGKTDQCSLVHDFAAEGSYDVQLRVREGAGVQTYARSVPIDDLLIASLGDSVGSGEGNPDRGSTFGRAAWQSRQCHRSALAGSAQAALAVENADDHTSVTFLHLACSGADIQAGLIGEYPGIESGFAALDPQVEALRQVAGHRTVDAVLISVGANDVYFGPVASFCLTHRNCPDRRFNPGKPGRVAPRGTPTARDVVRKRISRLPVLYERLARELKGIVPPERVFLSEYFDPTHDTHGHLCKLIGPPVLGITEEEARWAHDDLLVPLDAEIEAAAARHGWNAVTGIATAFGNHGYCAGPERWIRTIGESLRLLGTGGGKARLAGSLHPNAEGHKQIAVFLSGALQSRLHAPATARPSQPDPPDSGDPGGGAETPVAIALAGLGGLGLLGVPLARRWRKRRDRDGDQGGTHDEGVSAPSPVVETHASAWAAPESLHGEIAELLLTSSEWIHRRVDSVELLDDRTARRRVSVDFTLPRSSAARTRHAPLLLLRKQPLSNFDLRDEDGRPVPLLTRRQTGKITTSILVRLADAIAGTPLPGELIDACAAIAQGSPAEASRAMRFIATDLQPEPLRERIRRDVTFRELASTLVASFPVIVPVRDGDERRILKLAYDEPVAPSRGVLSALGWWGFSMLVDLPYLSASGSHHLEVRQSPGLEHVDAVLVTRNPDGTRTRTWQPGPASATHFYAGDAPRGSRGLAIVRMRTRREGLLRSGPVFAAATALALTGAWFALPGIATKAADVGPLLLAFPAVLAAFLASTGEHPVASRLLLGARTLVFASGLWSFLAAAALALNPSVLTLRWTLGAMALLGWLTFAALVATLALPRPRSPEERRRDGVA